MMRYTEMSVRFSDRTMRCSNCGSENPVGKKFCGNCGTQLGNSCPRCGVENPQSNKFCSDCGAVLAADSRTTASSNQLPSSAPAMSEISIAAGPASGAIPDGERKTVTALFADIKGSMELMEDLDPEEARAIVDPALRLMIDAVHRYDGYIVQSTGDGIFALFGAPVAHEDHPQRALYAALRMQEDIRRYAERLRAEKGINLQARVGVNTGEVVVRSIQTEGGHAEYTPIGHSTGLAARLQTLANPGAVVISETLRRLAEGYFQLKPLGPARIKGVNEPVELFEVTGLGPLRTRLQVAARRGLTKFVGRQSELEQMKRALELVRASRGQIVAAMGEPGVGKSRLFFEFKATALSGCLLLESYSVSHGKASAYLPVIELLREYFRIVPEDEPRQRRQKVIGKVLELDRSLEDALPYVFALLGIHEGDDPFAQMDAQIRRRRTQDALKRILLRESLGRPLIVVFEDLHWIDSETQALLNLLADSIANARILLLVNYRPEYHHQWGNKTYYTQLRLDPLGKTGAEEMLEALLVSAPSLPGQPAPPLPGQGEGWGQGIAELKRFILDRTQGNPFFIEEIVQALFEEGALVRNGVLKVVRPPSQVHVPATVQSVLASRIDRLPPEEKELLQTLAVIGREFPVGLIRAVARRTEAVFDGMLSHLQGAEFVYEQPAFPDVEYTFKHALTQEVAYNSVLLERRKLLHQRIAEAIESLFAERLEDHVKELALHYSRSGNALKAIEYLRRAGQQATSRAFFEEAITQLHAALELLPQLEDASARDSQLAIRVALMAPLNAINRIAAPENQQNLHRARVLCEQFGETLLLGRVLLGLFFVHWSIREFGLAQEYADQALALAERSADEISRFFAAFAGGFLAAMSAKYSSACGYFQRALAINAETRSVLVRSSDTALALVNCTGMLGYVLWMLGYPDQALEQQMRLVAILAEPIDPVALSLGIGGVLATRCDFLRDYRGMREQAQRLVAAAQDNGLAYYLGVGLTWLGRLMVVEADVDLGIETIAQGRRALEALGEVATSEVLNQCIASAYLEARRTDEGLAILEGAIAKSAAGGVRMYEADLHRLKGELLLAAGAPETEPEESLRQAIAIAQRQDAKGWELRATISLARLLKRQGKSDEARAMLADIYNWFTEGFDTADLKDAKALLDEFGV
jgi:class 3 adenylate cyclase